MRLDQQSPETGWPAVAGTGTVKVRPALLWAWRATIANWELWVAIAAISVVLIVLNFRLFLPLTPLVVAALIIPIASVTALRQTRERSFSIGQIRAPAYQETLLTALFVVAVWIGVLFAWSSLITSGLSDLFDARGFGEGAPMHRTAAFWLVGGATVLFNVLAPVLSMILFYTADNRSLWASLIPGAVAGLRNYGALLGIGVAATALNVVGLLCLGIGLCITLPVTLLALAHAYVQVVGEQVPTGRR